MRYNRKTILVLLFIPILLVSISCCKKDYQYPTDSLLGPWRCVDQIGLNYNFIPYQASIELNDIDSTQLIIINFHNLGYHVETYAMVKDTVITLIDTNFMDDIIGTGHFTRDFRNIYWEYFYQGQNFNAWYQRPN